MNDGGRHHTEYQHHRNRQAALHIAVVHLPCARDTGEDKGQKAVLFHGLFPLGGAAADALCSDLVQTVFRGQGKALKGVVQAFVEAVDGGVEFGAEAFLPGAGCCGSRAAALGTPKVLTAPHITKPSTTAAAAET